MQNPFTTTFSKIPGSTYIVTEQTAEIIENFNYDVPSESVYKITGVRGSGKTVLLAKIEEEFERDDIQSITDDLKSELFSYAYEKIWEELSGEDRSMVRLILDKNEYKREEVLKRMDKPGNYSIYRDRLAKRGIISTRQGYISLALPFFGDFVREYGV